jgi:uncharacterized protein with HEPN domain
VKDPRVYLQHILEAIDDIEAYASGGAERFSNERMVQDAVIRKLEVIGEATKQLPDVVKQTQPDVPWREIAGMRDKMIHDYFGVNLDIVWAVVERDMPPLRRVIEALLASQPPV